MREDPDEAFVGSDARKPWFLKGKKPAVHIDVGFQLPQRQSAEKFVSS